MSKQAVKLFELGFDVGFAAHQGERDNQEDSLGFKQLADGSLLAILSDGMGGHAAGEVASELAVKAFAEGFLQAESPITEQLSQALQHTQQRLSSHAQQYAECYQMGATLVAVLLHASCLHWISVGDSLLYRLSSKGDLVKLNQSHTLGERFRHLYEAGALSEQAYQHVEHPQALTSALGLQKLQEVDLNQLDLMLDDTLLLASDGLLTLSQEEIRAILSTKRPAQQLADALIAAVLTRQEAGQDNTSVIVIKRHQQKPSAKSTLLLSASAVIVALLVMVLGVASYQLFTLKERLRLLEYDLLDTKVQLENTKAQLEDKTAALRLLEDQAKKPLKSKAKS